MEFIRLGIISIIRDLFPGAVLWHAGNRQECRRILRHEKVTLLISDGTVDKKPGLGMVKEARALQPELKIMMLLESARIDHLSSVCLPGEIDRCIRKDAPVQQIYDTIRHVLSGTGA